MYCFRCSEERGPGGDFCLACGAALERRPTEAIQRDLGQHLFLLEALDRWVGAGEINRAFAERLSQPNRHAVALLEAALLEATACENLQPANPEEAKAGQEEPVPQPNGEPASAADKPRAAVLEAPAAEAAEPDARDEERPPVEAETPLEGEPAPAPSGAPAAVGASLAEGLEGLAEIASPPPSQTEVIVERESGWSRVWKPFLYDNAIWFVGAFCIVSGSLYVASQAWSHVGSMARSLIVLGMLLVYAAGFAGVGRFLGDRKGLTAAGRILGLIGAAIAPVAVLALEPIRLRSLGAFAAMAMLCLPALALLLRSTCDRFDRRLAPEVVGFGAALLAWETVAPWLVYSPALGTTAPLALLFLAAGVLRPRAPEVDRESQAFGALSLLYLAAFAIVRAHFEAAQLPGLEIDGPAATALGWIALRAELARTPPGGERPRPTGVAAGALALLAMGALCALVSHAGAAISATIAALALTDAARRYQRGAFVAAAGAIGLFAYELSPSLVPGAVWPLIQAAKAALGYPTMQALPPAYAGITALPYLLALLVLARRAHRRGQVFVYAPLAWLGLALAVLLSLLAHSSGDLRPALASSAALSAGGLAALWLVDHLAAGSFAGYALTLLAWDLARLAGGGQAGTGLAFAAAAIALSILSRVAPARGRPPLLFEAALLALTAPWLALGLATGSPPALLLIAAAAALATIAWESGSQLFAFAAAGSLLAAATEGLTASLVLAAAYATLLAAGLVRRPPKRPGACRFRPFGLDLPWPAEGFSLFEDPLALLSAGLALLALARAPASSGGASAVYALTALWSLLFARRYAAGVLTAFGWGLGALACSGSPAAMASYALALAALSVALERRADLARIAFRCEGPRASGPAAAFAALLPAYLAFGVERPAWLWAGVASYLVLLHWRPFRGAWFLPAFLAAWLALALHAPERGPLGAAALSLAAAALAFVSHRRPRLAAQAFGLSSDEAAAALTLIAHLGAVGAALALAGTSEHIATSCALLSAAYLVVARVDERPVWIGLAAALALGGGCFHWPQQMTWILACGALALAILANFARALPELAEELFAARPAAGDGNALAAAALLTSCAYAPAAFLGSTSNGEMAVQLLLASASTLLSGRALGFAPLLIPALELDAIALLLIFNDQALVPVALASAFTWLVLAIAARKSPALAARVFLDRPPEAKRVRVLRTVLVSGLVIACASVLFASLDRHGLNAAAHAPLLFTVAGLLALAVLAAPSPIWWTTAAATSLTAALLLDFRDPANGAALWANALLAMVAVLRVDAAWRAISASIARFDAEGRRPSNSRAYRAAITGVVACAVAAGALAVGAALYDRLITGHGVDPAAARFSLLLVATGLHLLFHRRGPLTFAMAMALPSLAAAYLAPSSYLAPALALTGLPLGALAAALPARASRRALSRMGLALPRARRRDAGELAFIYMLGVGALAAMATGLELGCWQTPAAAGILAAAFGVAGMRNRAGRAVFLVLLPLAAHLGLAYLGIRLSTGRPEAAILGAWAMLSGLLAIAAERLHVRRKPAHADALVAAHAYFVLGLTELCGALALMNGMKGSELAPAALAAALLGLFAALRALATRSEIYAYLAQGTLMLLYLLIRLQTGWVGRSSARDALSTVVLGFAFLGLHAAARRADARVFERPTRVVTHLLPLVGLVFAPDLDLRAQAAVAMAMALHYAAVSATTRGGKLAAAISGVALNVALAATWLDRGVHDPQFYAIPLGATLLAFARIFRDDLDATARFWLRTVGILAVYVASASSALVFAEAGYVAICALVCVIGVLLGVVLKVRVYVYLGIAFLVVDVLGNMARYGFREPILGGVFLTVLGLALVGSWVYFVAKREDLLRRYRMVQELMRGWE